MGINLGGIADWATEVPFVDVFRLSRPWISQREGAPWGQGPALDLDPTGNPRRLEPECYAETLVLTIEGGHYPSGEYILRYQGNGKVTASNAGQITATRKSDRHTEHTVAVDSTKGAVFLQLRETDPQDPVRNIRMFLPGHAPADPAATPLDPFRPGFLDTWRGVRIIRFMDWMETNNSHVKSWADRPRDSHNTWSGRGVPVETIIRLANTLRADPWLCVPHQADDDYIARLAETVARDLDPRLKLYIEYSNEVWNPQFEQHLYAAKRGAELQLGEQPWDNAWRYTALRSRQIFREFQKQFPPNRLVRVLPAQAGNPYVAGQILAFQDSGTEADALAIAPYIGLTPSPASDPSSDLMSTWSVRKILDQLAATQPQVTDWVRQHKTLADRYGLALVAYEGGQHMVGIQGGENNESLTRLFTSANRNPAMEPILDAYFRSWRESGGGAFAYFASMGHHSKWGSWGALEFMTDTPANSPKYRSLRRAARAWSHRVGPP